MLLFTSSTLFFSCNKTESEIEKDYLDDQVANLKTLKDEKWIVVLPGLGCKGCIQEAEAFMSKNINNKQIFFVLTKVESIKLLQQKTGIQINDHQNIYIDNENHFEIPSENGIYPLIIQLDNKKIKNYEFQSPKNGMAFSKLDDRLGSI